MPLKSSLFFVEKVSFTVYYLLHVNIVAETASHLAGNNSFPTSCLLGDTIRQTFFDNISSAVFSFFGNDIVASFF